MKNIEQLYIEIIVDMKSRLSEFETVSEEKEFWANYAIKRDIQRNDIADIVKDNENDSDDVKILKNQIREVLK